MTDGAVVSGIPDEGEVLIGLARAARQVDGEQPPHPATLKRWISRGVQAGDGRLVRLEGWKVGGRWRTSREAVRRFIAALNARPDAGTCEPTRPASRRREVDRAARLLDAAGIA